MLLHLIKKEILEHLMSLRFAIACILCLIVILCSLFVRCQDYQQVLDDYHQESAMERTRRDTISRYWDLLDDGVYVHRKPNPLKIFVRGISDTNGGTMHVPGRGRVRPIVQGLRNTSVPLFPSMDLVAFVGLIMSLMAIVFGYDAVCGEKQRGTLRLMLSYSVPRHLVLLSKWIGGYVTLIIPFLLTIVVGIVIVMIQKDVALSDSQWMRLILSVGFALLYVATMFSLSLGVSCLTARPATSVMVLLSVWVILVLAIPNLSPHIARLFRAGPNPLEVEEARNSATREAWREYGEKMAAYLQAQGISDRWWEDYHASGDDWEQRKKFAEMRIYEREVQKEAARKMLQGSAKVDQHYGRQMDAQVALTRWVGRISPFSCFAMAATEMGDVGEMADRRYTEQLAEYQIGLSAYAHDEAIAYLRKEYANQGERIGPWSRVREKAIPVFQYVPAAARDYARAVAADSGILVGMMLLLFMLSYMKFLRYDVR